jgi:hypothetical protein
VQEAALDDDEDQRERRRALKSSVSTKFWWIFRISGARARSGATGGAKSTAGDRGTGSNACGWLKR